MSRIDPATYRLIPVKVTYFEMHERPATEPEERKNVHFRLLPKPVDTDTYRFYYSGVGHQHSWLDRLVMDDEQLYSLINAEQTEIFAMHIDDQPAGYVELIRDKKFTEILYFGIMPAFIGQGWGKYALDWAIRKAWSYNPEWIQLNTCELDHPHAIQNYRKRGFRETKTDIQERKILVE